MALREVNGVRLLVEESGDGEPFVLVHGSWGDRDGWVLVEPVLAEHFHVVSYNRRGHSGSENGAPGATRRDDEDDLEALIEVLDLGPVHLFGSSFGGSTALGLATRRPDLLRTLAVHEPPLVGLVPDDPAAAAMSEGVPRVIEIIESGDLERGARTFVEEVALGPGYWEMMPEPSRAAMVANAGTFPEAMADPGALTVDLDALGRLELPVLLSKGDQSPAFFAPIIERLAEAMPRATVHTHVGAGHVPHVTHPEEWVTTLRGFAESA